MSRRRWRSVDRDLTGGSGVGSVGYCRGCPARLVFWELLCVPRDSPGTQPSQGRQRNTN